MTKQHNKFLSRLDCSRVAVFRVAEYLHKAGFDITIPAIRFAPSANVHADYIDEGDIIAVKKNEKHRIEVKQVSTNFYDLESWPYPIAFVSNVATVDRAEGMVTAYIFVNPEMTHMGIIWAKTKSDWVIKETHAQNTQNIERFYACPAELVDFREL